MKVLLALECIISLRKLNDLNRELRAHKSAGTKQEFRTKFLFCLLTYLPKSTRTEDMKLKTLGLSYLWNYWPVWIMDWEVHSSVREKKKRIRKLFFFKYFSKSMTMQAMKFLNLELTRLKKVKWFGTQIRAYKSVKFRKWNKLLRF